MTNLTTTTTSNGTSDLLSEANIIAGFHSILQDSMTQARGEGLLTDEEISVGDVDVQIAGPALALFFGALGSKGDPPEIASPDGSFVLRNANCPPSFFSFFSLWQRCVPAIKKLPSETRHDLALLLCDKEPLGSPIRSDVVRLSGDLKAVAIEITQRRTFQLRFQHDLQRALDSNVRPRKSGESDRAHFNPPPGYDTSPTSTTLATPTSPDSSTAHVATSPATETPEHKENLSVIRETLYSALADTIVTTPSIVQMIAKGPDWASRAFFSATCLAILEVVLTRVSPAGVRVVDYGRSTPRIIGPAETPEYLRPFLGTLLELSDTARGMAEEDDERAMREAAEGDVTSEPKLERLKERLERGAGVGDVEGARASVDGQVAMLANAINQVAIGLAGLPAFKERQAEAFKILISVTSL